MMTLVQAAIKAGVTVCLATGKARPAALAALTPVGLAGQPRFCPIGWAQYSVLGQQVQLCCQERPCMLMSAC